MTANSTSGRFSSALVLSKPYALISKQTLRTNSVLLTEPAAASQCNECIQCRLKIPVKTITPIILNAVLRVSPREEKNVIP